MLAARASATPLPSNDRKRRRARICWDPPYGLPADALALVKGGVPITKISIGHMQAGEGKRPITPAVAVDDADVAAFKELQKLGIELEIRYLPSPNPDPIGNLFN